MQGQHDPAYGHICFHICAVLHFVMYLQVALLISWAVVPVMGPHQHQARQIWPLAALARSRAMS